MKFVVFCLPNNKLDFDGEDINLRSSQEDCCIVPLAR